MLGDLADSLAMSRGQKPRFDTRSPALQAIGNRTADPLEIAIFDEIVRERIRVKNQKFSLPGGPDETAMGKLFPMQRLDRHTDPLEEILGIKVDAVRRQFAEREATRARVREQQRK